MIFGNPGVYDNNGEISHFALSVEKLFEPNKPIIALNLLINLTYYPRDIATNIASVYLGNLDTKHKLFHQQSYDLFHLNDKKLLKLLISNRYYDKNNFPENDYFWDLDTTEYANRGFYPYIIHSEGRTRVVMISNPLNKFSKTFKKKYWKIVSTILSTEDFLKIIKQAKYFIENSFHE